MHRHLSCELYNRGYVANVAYDLFRWLVQMHLMEYDMIGSDTFSGLRESGSHGHVGSNIRMILLAHIVPFGHTAFGDSLTHDLEFPTSKWTFLRNREIMAIDSGTDDTTVSLCSYPSTIRQEIIDIALGQWVEESLHSRQASLYSSFHIV